MVRMRQVSDLPRREFILRLETGEEINTTVLAFAERHDVRAAGITGIGALSDATLGFFDLDRRDYHRNEFNEQAEIVSLIGNLAEKDGKPKLHAHIVLARRDGSTLGGHLLGGHVRPTLELVILDTPHQLRRKTDPETGLALLDMPEDN